MPEHNTRIPEPLTIISLISRQTWPQILAVAHFNPEQLLLLHSDDSVESKEPARRITDFFNNQPHPFPSPKTSSAEIPHDDFAAIEKELDQLIPRHNLNLAECMINFTGGNKLMATAAFRWAIKRGITAFYLERGNSITLFKPTDNDVETSTHKIDPATINECNPVDLLRCQSDVSVVEREGRNITLNTQGHDMPEADFLKRIDNGNDPTPFLDIHGEADNDAKAGDLLERLTAATLLKLGVKQVQHSLRLKVKTARHNPHAEIDLIFVWNGRLWLVDCKDQKPTENLIQSLNSILHTRIEIDERLQTLLDRIAGELKTAQTKIFKEDLIAVRETGGLLGTALCIRKSAPIDDAAEFARVNNIELILKNDMIERLQHLLHPNATPSNAQLLDLQNHFS